MDVTGGKDQSVTCTLARAFITVNPDILFSRIALKHIYNAKNSRLWHVLPLSVDDRVISPFLEGLIFTKLRICEVSRK